MKRNSRTNSMNHLVGEKSPYLIQHANNPVNWYPWREDAFLKARAEQLPIFLSIGYSTCYWCHVMEHESFENEAIAQFLNEHFVAIKLDREERPDVDSIYMDAVVSLSGRGGWPLSVFLTPELKPFYGGTYFPPDHFLQLLKKISEAWAQNQEGIIESAQELTSIVQHHSFPALGSSFKEEVLAQAVEQIRARFDEKHGGFGSAPKFPPCFTLQLLFREFVRRGEKDILEMAILTLQSMANGGIYDHIGGGFHRYATDTLWRIPHFEKMLYDNAQLVTTYLEAYELTKKEMFLTVAEETLNYVLRDMTAPKGGFYSAEDAGEVGREGEFYTWPTSEIQTVLTNDEWEELGRNFSFSRDGNFEHGRNIFYLAPTRTWADRESALCQSALRKLFVARKSKRRPHRDDKILTAWNGLMIAAFAQGYGVTSNEKYLFAAARAARFVKSTLWLNGVLHRRYRDGEAHYLGTLEDYAFLIYGLIALYEAGHDERWLRWAYELQAVAEGEFWDESQGGYFKTSHREVELITRQKEFTDGAEPSGNGISLLNNTKLYHLTLEKHFLEKRNRLLQSLPKALNEYPSAFGSSLLCFHWCSKPCKEIVVLGPKNTREGLEFYRLLGNSFLPNKVLVWSETEVTSGFDVLPILKGKKILNAKTTFYICEEGNCNLPTNDPQEALNLVLKY